SYSASELQSMEGLVESTGMTVTEILSLLGDRTTDIHVNGTTYWRNIPSNVWRFTVGGYQIIKKWLSYRLSNTLKVMIPRSLKSPPPAQSITAPPGARKIRVCKTNSVPAGLIVQTISCS